MLRSLITQIFAQCRVDTAVQMLFKSTLDGVRQPSHKSLLQTLKELIKHSDETFIILDALDECTGRTELFKDIEEIAQWKLGKLHFLVTSRKEYDIEDILNEVFKRNILSLAENILDGDVRIYVDGRLRTDQKLQKWKRLPDIQKEIETHMVSKFQGM